MPAAALSRVSPVEESGTFRQISEVFLVEANDDPIKFLLYFAGFMFALCRFLNLRTILVEGAKKFLVSLSAGATRIHKSLRGYSALDIVASLGVATEQQNLDRGGVDASRWVRKN